MLVQGHCRAPRTHACPSVLFIWAVGQLWHCPQHRWGAQGFGGTGRSRLQAQLVTPILVNIA